MQIWKDIEGYKGHYQISNYGNVRSLKKDAFLRKCAYLKGYKIISLWKNGIGKMFRVHRLVAAAFIPNPENKPCVDHIDGDRANNHADNLRWVTAKENCNNPITKSRLHKKDWRIYDGAIRRIAPTSERNCDVFRLWRFNKNLFIRKRCTTGNGFE